MRVILVALALAVTPVALAGSIPSPSVLPSAPFPAPATDAASTGPQLVLVSSRYRDPGILPPDLPAAPDWAPDAYRGAALETAFRQGSKVFLVYDGRYLIGANAR